MNDRVVVIKKQDIGEVAIGEIGTIIAEVGNKEDSIIYVVKFDNHFSDLLIDSEEAFHSGKMVDGDCWGFKPESIRKID